MSYGVFTKDGNGLINGARIEKQIVLVSVKYFANQDLDKRDAI